MNDSDPSAAYDRLRTETAEMLKLDPANLSLVEGLQLDLIALLRLTTSDMQGAALAGEQVDLGRLASALGMLRQLLPEKSLVASPAAAPETRFGVDHRARLRDLIERTVLAAEVPDPAEAELRRDILAREEMASALAAGVPPPVTPPPPPLPGNVVQLPDATERANSRMPPAHYLKEGQPREPWERGGTFEVPSWPLPR